MSNSYSTTWFALFLETIDPEQTEREAAFIARWLPQPTYSTVLDLCCGPGRHARALARRGYRVTGVDVSIAALTAARRDGSDHIIYIERDMRELDSLPGPFDAAICLWQSFGNFDAATNIQVLRQIHCTLRPGGRFVLDIYHRDFFERNQGVRSFERAGRAVTETKQLTGDRLTVRLDYASGNEADIYEWQLFTPQEIGALAEQTGFATLATCTGFDEAAPPIAAQPRMQLVFERQ